MSIPTLEISGERSESAALKCWGTAMKGLMHLVEQAKALAGESTCERDGHDWQTDGGRGCPTGNGNCSQAVYVCARCGETDYGDSDDGPGMTDCRAACGDSMTGWRPDWMDESPNDQAHQGETA